MNIHSIGSSISNRSSPYSSSGAIIAVSESSTENTEYDSGSICRFEVSSPGISCANPSSLQTLIPLKNCELQQQQHCPSTANSFPPSLSPPSLSSLSQTSYTYPYTSVSYQTLPLRCASSQMGSVTPSESSALSKEQLMAWIDPFIERTRYQEAQEPGRDSLCSTLPLDSDVRAHSPSTKTMSNISTGNNSQRTVSFEESMDSNVLYLKGYDNYMAEYGMPGMLLETDGDTDCTDDINSGNSNNRPSDARKVDAAPAFNNSPRVYVISQQKNNLPGKSKAVDVSCRELSLVSSLKKSCSYEDLQEQRSALFTATDVSLSLSLPPWRKEPSSGDSEHRSPDPDIHMDAYESIKRCPEEPHAGNAAPPSVNSRPSTDTPHMVSAIIPSPVATRPPVASQPLTKNRDEAPPIHPLARNVALTSPLSSVSIAPRLKQHRQPTTSPHVLIERSKFFQPADVSYNYKTTYWQHRCRQLIRQRLGSEGSADIHGQPRPLRRASAGQANAAPLSNGPSTKSDDPLARPAQGELDSPSSRNLCTSSEFAGCATAAATTNATLTTSSPAIVATSVQSLTTRPSYRTAEFSPVQKIYYGEPQLWPASEDTVLASPLLSRSNVEGIFDTATNATSVETSSSSRSSKEKKRPPPVNMGVIQLMEAERTCATLFLTNGDISRKDGHPSSQLTYPTSAEAGVGAIVFGDGDTVDSSTTKKGRRIWDSSRLAMKLKSSNLSASKSGPIPSVSNHSLATMTPTTMVEPPETPCSLSVPERRPSVIRSNRRSVITAMATTITTTVSSPARLGRFTHNKSKSQDYNSNLHDYDSNGGGTSVGTGSSMIAAVMASFSLPGSPNIKQKNTVSPSATFASSSATLWADDDHMAQFDPPSSAASVFWSFQSPPGLPSLSPSTTIASFEPSSPSIKRKKSILHEKLFGKWNRKLTASAVPEPSPPMLSNNTDIPPLTTSIASSSSTSTSSIACSATECDRLCQHDKLCQQENRHYSNDTPRYHESFTFSTNEIVHVYDIHENNNASLCPCSGGGYGSSISGIKEDTSSSPSPPASVKAQANIYREQHQSPNANALPLPVSCPDTSPPFLLSVLKAEPAMSSPPTTLQQHRPRPKTPLSQRPMGEIWANLLTVQHLGVLPPNAEQLKQSRVASHQKKDDSVSGSNINIDSGTGVRVGVGLGVSIGTDATAGTENWYGDYQQYSPERILPEKNVKEEEEDIRRVMQQWQAWGAAYRVRNE